MSPTSYGRSALWRAFHMVTKPALLPALLVILTNQFAHAGSATWNLSPTTGDWNTAANWTPATVPNGPDDTATFGVSNKTDLSLSADVEVSEIDFSAGASAYTNSLPPVDDLTISGAGILNKSGVSQQFVTQSDYNTNNSDIIFTNSATAGSGTVFTVVGGDTEDYDIGPRVSFEDTSSADHATFEILGCRIFRAGGGSVFIDVDATATDATFVTHEGVNNGQSGYLSIVGNAASAHITNDRGYTQISGKGGNCTITNKKGGDTSFTSAADAENATIINQGGTFPGDYNYGSTGFSGTATAGNAIIVSQGGKGQDAAGGHIGFSGYYGTPTAGNATLIANGGVDGGEGGNIVFSQGSVDGGTARLELFGNGNLDITQLQNPNITIGSLEGDGLVFLGTNSLTVGSNNHNATFAGVIEGLGGLTKIGKGKQLLSGASSYTGGTIVSDGTLLVANTIGSATGPGRLQVQAGSLGGSGIIVGAVQVGTGGGPGATLSPGTKKNLGTLTLQNRLTLKADASYSFLLNSTLVDNARLSVRGVMIDSRATFAGFDQGTATVPVGTTFIVISNTALKSITGNFSNLPDGSTTKIGKNTFQASYEGGDGNDFTLTVVQ